MYLHKYSTIHGPWYSGEVKGWAFINLADRCGVSRRIEDEYYIILYYYYYEKAILPSPGIHYAHTHTKYG